MSSIGVLDLTQRSPDKSRPPWKQKDSRDTGGHLLLREPVCVKPAMSLYQTVESACQAVEGTSMVASLRKIYWPPITVFSRTCRPDGKVAYYCKTSCQIETTKRYNFPGLRCGRKAKA